MGLPRIVAPSQSTAASVSSFSWAAVSGPVSYTHLDVYKRQTQAAVGSSTVDALRSLRVDVAFGGTNGFTPSHGFSTPDPAEGDVKRAMVASARQVFMLADSSKFGSDYLVSFAKPGDVDVLVTDRGLDPDTHQSLSLIHI